VPDETADVVALWRLQSTYADVVTRRAWPELDELFTAEAAVVVDTVSAEPRTFVGAAALATFISTAVERFDHFEFVILNPLVDVLGADEARGRIFMCEIRHDRSTDEWSTAYGLYQDRYQRIDGRWLIAARRYRSLARTGANSGIFGVPTDLEPFSR
jgi:hypothetical protein